MEVWGGKCKTVIVESQKRDNQKNVIGTPVTFEEKVD